MRHKDTPKNKIDQIFIQDLLRFPEVLGQALYLLFKSPV